MTLCVPALLSTATTRPASGFSSVPRRIEPTAGADPAITTSEVLVKLVGAPGTVRVGVVRICASVTGTVLAAGAVRTTRTGAEVTPPTEAVTWLEPDVPLACTKPEALTVTLPCDCEDQVTGIESSLPAASTALATSCLLCPDSVKRIEFGLI